MKRFALLTTILTAVLVLVLPFIGGGGPALQGGALSATADETGLPIFASTVAASTSTSSASVDPALAAVHQSESAIESEAAATAASLKQDTEHLAQKPVPIPAPPVTTAAAARAALTLTPDQRRAARAAAGQSCPTGGGGGGSAPGGSDGQGVTGTTTSDIQSFSATFNAIRVANCLDPIPSGNFRYDSCMEQRLFWMAEDPSTDPNSAWGHIGSVRSDGVPSRGCDGNLAGGSGNSGATVATKWWNSIEHRLSLYRPSYTGSTAGVCIYFAMSHGGIPNEPSSFTRAAARWGGC